MKKYYTTPSQEHYTQMVDRLHKKSEQEDADITEVYSRAASRYNPSEGDLHIYMVQEATIQCKSTPEQIAVGPYGNITISSPNASEVPLALSRLEEITNVSLQEVDGPKPCIVVPFTKPLITAGPGRCSA